MAYDLSRFPIIPLYAKQLGLSPQLIGFAVAASTVTGIFGKFIAGGLSDSLGRKLLMVIACGIATVLPCGYFLATGATSLIGLRLCHGWGTAIMGPVGRAFISDIIPAEKRGNLLSTYTATTNLGTMAGRSLGGLLLFWGGFFYPFAASALAGLIALWIAMRWPRDSGHSEIASLSRRFLEGFREVSSNLAVLLTSFVESVQYFALGFVDAFLPIYATEQGLSSWQVGLLYGIQMGAIILSKPFMGWISDRFGRKPQILAGLVCGGLIVWRLPWETTFFLLASLATLFGLTVGVTTSATSALVTDLCKRHRYGAAHGVFGTILDIGHAAGPIAAGFLVGHLGYRAGFAITSLVLILASLSFHFLVKEERIS